MLDETETLTGQPLSPSTSARLHLQTAIVDMAITGGAQGCGTTSKSLYFAKEHFERGQRAAFEGMLLDPRGDLIAVFLMMSVYMLCNAKRNGAFIYLGVAARLAQAMDLHAPSQPSSCCPRSGDSRRIYSETTHEYVQDAVDI